MSTDTVKQEEYGTHWHAAPRFLPFTGWESVKEAVRSYIDGVEAVAQGYDTDRYFRVQEFGGDGAFKTADVDTFRDLFDGGDTHRATARYDLGDHDVEVTYELGMSGATGRVSVYGDDRLRGRLEQATGVELEHVASVEDEFAGVLGYADRLKSLFD